jgi:CxxC motif-containing protein
MRKMTCIICPNGCKLEVTQEGERIEVKGNQCKRGETFGIMELREPKRTISSTVKTIFPKIPVLPVRVSDEIPKDRIFDVMVEINKVRLDYPVGRGEIILANVLGLGVDIIATSNIMKTNEK